MKKFCFTPISGINHINLSNQTYVDKKTIVQSKKFKWKNTENVEKHKKIHELNKSLLHKINIDQCLFVNAEMSQHLMSIKMKAIVKRKSL